MIIGTRPVVQVLACPDGIREYSLKAELLTLV